jgi:hypothetical protein
VSKPDYSLVIGGVVVAAVEHHEIDEDHADQEHREVSP